MATASTRVLAPSGVATPGATIVRKPRTPLVQALQRVVRNPMGLIGVSIMSLLIVGALAAPVISPYDPIAQNPGAELRAPSGQFLLGTDNLGRDLLSRIIFGARNSLLVGVVAVGLGAGVA